MHLQSELENYKLQVELLQEKLHRSEDNRQELEGKLEQIMKKRREHEMTLRSRSQRKYQQFLDEQKKRNERNRKLVDMLEHIDQQAAALAARSERLKMMKLQYEFYFSKLVQSQSMKTLQSMPTVPLLPAQRHPNPYPTIKTDDVVPVETYQTSFNSTTPQFQTVPIPVVVPIPNDQNRFHRGWAFATAPPGVLITLANNSTLPPTDTDENKKNESNFSFDYAQFPIGYLQSTTTANSASMQSKMEQLHQQNPSKERHAMPLFAPDKDIKQSRPYFEFKEQALPLHSFADVKTNETQFSRTRPTTKHTIFDSSTDKTGKDDEFEGDDDSKNGQELEKLRVAEMPDSDSFVDRQSLKVDILPGSRVSPGSTFHQRTQNGRVVHRGSKSNTIDFRSDNDADYIKYINEMKETYERNISSPVNVTPQEESIDNITTTLQIQKIDETNVKDDGKINDIEDNEKNTSSALPPLGGKCSMESIGDEALRKKSLENRTVENTSNTAARNTDPSRDTEQITLFNGTKNSRDESTGANNRTAAIIDGGGENIKSIEGTGVETSYRPMHFDKKEKMSIESIETAIYGERIANPETLTSSALLNIPVGGLEAEPNPPQGERSEFNNNSVRDSYEEEKNPITVEQQQGQAQGPVDNELNDTTNGEVSENDQANYNYAGNDSFTGIQEYDAQNFNYLDPGYKESSQTDAYYGKTQEEQAYNYTEDQTSSGQTDTLEQQYDYTGDGQQPQTDNYSAEYQNYDASQYQGEYDANAYQYDYSQQQYEDPNQGQYSSDIYGQEYQQDPYSGEYAPYNQSGSNEAGPSYEESQYAPNEQEEALEQNDNPVTATDLIETEVDTTKPDTSINDEPTTDEVNPKKQNIPTSILSTEKQHNDAATKKKKRVNFVDSETDESSTLPKPDAASSESDFDFSANQ